MNSKSLLLEKMLGNKFDLNTFSTFSTQLFNIGKLKLEQGKKCHDIWIEYSGYVKSYEEIGVYEDPSGYRLVILAVELEKVGNSQRARSMQRSFTSKYIRNRNCDGAFVAFYSECEASWRLSFVRLDSAFVSKAVKIDIIPVKRYSYLVGEGEPKYTAESQLIHIFKGNGSGPTLQEIESAFSVEKVTRDFFNKYRQQYVRLKEFLEADDSFISESKKLGIELYKFSEQFSKKLMSQLAFLYFLQKKGWLGVEPGCRWGTGSSRFIREIYRRYIEQGGKNFFKDCLEPLFYEAFNFDFTIPNEIFSNVHKRKGNEEGILDMFDKFNFTISEAEPLEKEVAIDPGMLGSIFENLLDAGHRKSNGAFYTPGEIVRYMCREGLINYLTNELELPYDDVKEFILYGEFIRDADNINKNIFNNILKIDSALKRVKVADPAAGSGAFALGMLNEIVRVRNSITEYIVIKGREEKNKEANDGKFIRRQRSPYSMKLEIIKNCIFAVDIEQSAVDIAKLRLWLSALSDQDVNDETSKYHTFPDLSLNIKVGNSLAENFLWEAEFFNVFKEKGGFDIVIGNPPYVDYRKIDYITKCSLKGYETYRDTKNASLYVYFIEKGWHLLNAKGSHVFINPCQYLTADSGLGLRKFLAERRAIKKIVDVSNIRAFKSASTYTCINVFSKEKNHGPIAVYKPESLSRLEENYCTLDYDDIRQKDNYIVLLNPNPVAVRMDMVKTRLKDFADLFCGTSMPGFRKFVIPKYEAESKDVGEYVPLIESGDIYKFRFEVRSYVNKVIYPEHIQHVFKFNENLFMARMTKRVRVCRPQKGFYAGKVNCITNIGLDIDYMAAVLNSSLIDYYYNIKNESKHLCGGYLGFDIPSVESIPIPCGSDTERKKLASLARDIYLNIEDKKLVEDIQREIDIAVYGLYKLTREEIDIVEKLYIK